MYTYDTKVSYSKVNNQGIVPLYEILNYLQDCSTFQSDSLGIGIDYLREKKQAWIIVAYNIKIEKQLKLNDEITVGTTPVDIGNLFANRQFFIKDKNGEFMVKADTIWIMLDMDSRKAIKIPDDYRDVYEYGKAFEDVKAKRKLRLNEDKKQVYDFTVKKTYIDTNGHMNNAQYLREMQEILPDDFIVSNAQIVYNNEAILGQKVLSYVHNADEGMEVSFENEDGEIFTTIKMN